MLEAVPRTAAQQQDVRPLWVNVNQEVAVGAVFILADLGADQRRTAQVWKAPISEGDDLGECGVGRFPALRVRIDLDAMLVVRELETARLQVRKTVEDVPTVEVRPSGHRAGLEPAVAGRGSKIEDFLSRRQDPRPDLTREQLRQPGPASEDETVRADAFTGREADFLQSLAQWRLDQTFYVGPAILHEAIDQRQHRSPRHQRAELWLVEANAD